MIAVVRYNAGNITSVRNALNRLGYENVITDDPGMLMSAEKVIFPGVGEAGSAMKYLREKQLDKIIKKLDMPVLGICLGLQLMCSYSEESSTQCLGIFDTVVRRFPEGANYKIPHMGWNNFTAVKGELFSDVDLNDDVYYVHSYYAEQCNDTLARCEYIVPFSAALGRDNFFATQFHPEKSATTGEKILKNFLEL